jgi:hypothetical protein
MLRINALGRAAAVLAVIASFNPAILKRAGATEDAKPDAPTQEADERSRLFADWMREYAEGTTIAVVGRDDRSDIQLVPNPIFRYSDQPQLIPDATLWVWTRNSRPIAFQKVEGNDFGGGQAWTICFDSLSEELLKVSWTSGRQYTSRTPGVAFKPIPDADAPAENPRQRAIQIRALKDRFTARLGVDAARKGGAEARTISKPLFEYREPESNNLIGSIFGMSSTGTNPDLLVLIEVRPGEDGKPQWQYAYSRITSNSLILRLDDKEIWSEVAVATSPGGYDTWTYYFLPRSFK